MDLNIQVGDMPPKQIGPLKRLCLSLRQQSIISQKTILLPLWQPQILYSAAAHAGLGQTLTRSCLLDMTIGKYLLHQQCEVTEKCSINGADNSSWNFLHFVYTYTTLMPPQVYADHSKVLVNYGYCYNTAVYRQLQDWRLIQVSALKGDSAWDLFLWPQWR